MSDWTKFYFAGSGYIQNADTLRVTDRHQASYPITHRMEDPRHDHLQQPIRMDSYGFSNHASLDNLDKIAVIEDDIKESEM